MKTNIILLVEDNGDDVALTLDAFRHANLPNRVVVARDGRTALDYLFREGAHAGRAEGDDPAVVLLDLKVPKMDGFEVLKRIRGAEGTRRLPVVMLTSSKEDRDVAASYELGANSYIRKPVDFDQFLAAMRQLGLYWLQLNEPPPKECKP